MKLTNRTGLPQPLVDAIQFDSYKASGTISCSALIDAPQIRVLKKLHSSEIENDVSEYLFALLGTACHHILERSHISDIRKRSFLMVVETLNEKAKEYSGVKKEEIVAIADKLLKMMFAFFPEVESRYIYENTLHYEYGKQLLSGTFDIFDKQEKCLFDYKVCSIYAFLYPESRKKWSDQCNVYAFMLRNAGYEVDEINIVCIFRDWSASRVVTSKDYPSKQFMVIPIQVRPQAEVKKYIESRLDLHSKAEKGEIPECSGAERWASSNEWVVKTPKLKKAIRKFDNEGMANIFMRENQHKYELGLSVFVRPGESKRCQSYCPVSAFCEQKKREDQQHEEMIKES